MAKLSYRQIIVGHFPAGMQGLDEVFNELYEQNHSPDKADLGAKLIKRAREHNYIPKSAVDDYARALLREYRKYCDQRREGKKPKRINYGTWRGYPREQIPWFPTIDMYLCDGCGLCLTLCRAGVLAPLPDGLVEIVEPLKCEVGCSSCADICKPGAITFPLRNILDAFRPGGCNQQHDSY